MSPPPPVLRWSWHYWARYSKLDGMDTKLKRRLDAKRNLRPRKLKLQTGCNPTTQKAEDADWMQSHDTESWSCRLDAIPRPRKLKLQTRCNPTIQKAEDADWMQSHDPESWSCRLDAIPRHGKLKMQIGCKPTTHHLQLKCGGVSTLRHRLVYSEVTLTVYPGVPCSNSKRNSGNQAQFWVFVLVDKSNRRSVSTYTRPFSHTIPRSCSILHRSYSFLRKS